MHCDEYESKISKCQFGTSAAIKKQFSEWRILLAISMIVNGMVGYLNRKMNSVN